jgi:hypothetical protein
MTDDFIEKAFADLDDFYPGSKRKRREKVEKQPEDVTWDAKPFIKTLPNGKDVEMFTLGALATALNRPVITLRAWMTEGYLPTSPYRLPSTVDKNGKEVLGRRLYTRPMIEMTVELFTKAGILHAKRIDWALHRQLINEIAESWDKIRESETETTETN